MKNVMLSVIAVAIALMSFSPLMLLAQDNTPKINFNSMDYMKVTPGMGADYVQLEAVWKKIHLANIKEGKYDFWELTSVMYPSGTSREYDYVTRIQCAGEKQYAAFLEGEFFPKNWTSLLTPDEIDLVMRTGEIRKLVKSEVYVAEEYITAENMGHPKIHVFNYFDFPKGKNRSDHFKVEKEIWKPVHQARINDGKLKGWVLARKLMPFGASMPYHDATVDLYESMEHYLNTEMMKYFEKVHTKKDTDNLLARTNANSILVKGDVRVLVDNTAMKEEGSTASRK